jgi:xanthosine utilization system XapX-like protein
MDTARHLFHLGFVGPLFLYIGIARSSTPDIIFNIIGVLALVIIGYHSYKAYQKIMNNSSAWVNWIHILLIAPLLLILAYMKKNAHNRYYEMLLLLGFAAIGYHGLYLIREIILM